MKIMIHANKGLQLCLHLILNVISALKFLFSLPLSPPFIINHPETVNWCNFLFVSTFVATLGENCLISVQRDCNLENYKRQNYDGTDFKMGVAATLQELSEWTLPKQISLSYYHHQPPVYKYK